MEFKLTRRTITHADLTAAATTEVETILTYPANTVIANAFIKVVTAFTGGGVGSCVVELGQTAVDVDAYLKSTSVFSGTPVIGDALAEKGDSIKDALVCVKTSSGTVDLLFTVDTTTAALTAGELDVYVLWYTFPA